MMKAQWQSLMKPAFLIDITKLPAKEMQQVMEKITLLTLDPRPDGKMKKQLTHVEGRPYRLRSGIYRIFYTFNEQVVTLYKLSKRREDTYKHSSEAEFSPDADALDEDELKLEESEITTANQPDWEKIFAQSEPKNLPEPITAALLKQLQVNPVYHQRLLPLKTQDELLGCPGVDELTLLKIDEYMFDRPLIQVMQEQDLILNEVDDLLRYKEGELIAFLLKLSPEQERYASWSLTSSGPTLVKGGPGTGKSTVALYRIRSFIEQYMKQDKGAPRILFTTYTNALIRSSQQLLQQLLGMQAQFVSVETADSVAYQILHSRGQSKQLEIARNEELPKLLRQAISEAVHNGNPLQVQAQKQTIERMGLDYLLQEINSLIVARQITSLKEYVLTSRSGRMLRLNAIQRSAVWQIYERWCELLRAKGWETWQQRRARAVSLVESSALFQYYDAVVIDEAQDLDPTALRMLVQLCKAPNRLFITADANQSIYGSSFSWSEVHASLKFQGRTSILRTNYRSTLEIGEGAQDYLITGQLEPEIIERRYINNGPLPDARMVLNIRHETQLLANFFKKATRSLRLTLGSCAVLTPSDNVGQMLASGLREQGIEATFMVGRELDLSRSGIKVITLKSSKGLEFPIVALAGFTASSYPNLPKEAVEDEINELLSRERRTMFVGMTRAMRALLVILPINAESNPLFQGFNQGYWNFTRAI